jgi:cell division protein FtsW
VASTRSSGSHAGARSQGSSAPQGSSPPQSLVPVRRLFAAENRNYFLLLSTTLFLVVFGLVMVLSASFVEANSAGENAFGAFMRQSLYAIIGVPLMLIASRMPPKFWKRWAWPALLLGAAFQLLVFTGLGFGYGGNRNWISIGGLNAQPSEFVKLALIVWIAWVLSAKQDLLSHWKHVAVPIAPVAGIAIVFVLLGGDLGTASIMLMIVLGCLFVAGVKLRFLGVAVVVVSVLGVLVALASPSRVSRIQVWMNGCGTEDYAGYCWQVLHGTWALASGGLFGVGLGNSKAKWNWLPEADNDFIFAIIGEELGLIGAIVVLVLFIVLAISFVRIIRSTRDNFARVATAGVMVWVVGQAFVNIAVVLGLLPVLGVPLPLISAGGSALIATLIAIGVVLSFARHDGVGDQAREKGGAPVPERNSRGR